MYQSKFQPFKEWLQDVVANGYDLSKIKTDVNVYEFLSEEGDVLAFWCRDNNYGTIKIN